VLPKCVQKEHRTLIIKGNSEEKSLSLMEEIEESLKQVKLIREGKLPKRTMRDVLDGEQSKITP